jgi:hypothetical protein
MFLADCEGHFDILPNKFALNRPLQYQITTIAGNQNFGNRAGITEFAFPWPLIVGIRVQQATLFMITSSMIIAIKVTTVNRTFTHQSYYTLHRAELLVEPH